MGLGELSVGQAAALLAVSLAPGLEPRYAVALALAMGLGYSESVAIGLAGVALLAVALTVAVEAVMSASRRACVLWESRANPACIYISSVERSRSKLKRYLDTWGVIGLALFVAIPLPATGMYTGAAAAALLGLKGARLAAALAAGGAVSVVIVAVAVALGLEAVSEG